jgi:hypothetical protein
VSAVEHTLKQTVGATVFSAAKDVSSDRGGRPLLSFSFAGRDATQLT